VSDVAVVDYGMGNLRSVAKAIEHVAPRLSVEVTSDARQVARAARVVFPGQGAMPDCMREMEARGLRAAVLEAAATKPFLGICIGLQMLFEASEEGDTPGLGLLPGRVQRFPGERMADERGARLKVPHMGWNEVRQTVEHPLWRGIPQDSRFYFVHSYYLSCNDTDAVIATCTYGAPFAAVVARDNIAATQFHPEKSQDSGIQVLKNFARWEPAHR